MTPAEQAKEAGLKDLSQVSRMTKQSRQTLYNWHKNKPELFKIILIGCKAKLSTSCCTRDKKELIPVDR